MILPEVAPRHLVEAGPDPIDTRPACFVFGQGAETELIREEPNDLARGMGLDLIMRQVVAAPHHFRAKILRQRLHERRSIRPAERGQEFPELIGLVERRQNRAHIRVPERMDGENHCRALSCITSR